MSLQDEYDQFRRGYWACADKSECLCHGSGWALSDLDTWHQCPIHFKGQTHPECAMEEPADDVEETPDAEDVFGSGEDQFRDVECVDGEDIPF